MDEDLAERRVTDLLAEVETLLRVDPSPDFLARVRTAIDVEPDVKRWRLSPWALALPAAAAAVWLVVAVWGGAPQPTAPSATSIAGPAAAEVAPELPLEVPTASVPLPPRRPQPRSRDTSRQSTVESRTVEVIVSESEAQALHRFFVNAAQGRAPEALATGERAFIDTTGTMNDLEIAAIAIEPLDIAAQ